MGGLDGDIWALYNIPYQPVSVLIANGVIVDRWFGPLAEPEMRERSLPGLGCRWFQGFVFIVGLLIQTSVGGVLAVGGPWRKRWGWAV